MYTCLVKPTEYNLVWEPYINKITTHIKVLLQLWEIQGRRKTWCQVEFGYLPASHILRPNVIAGLAELERNERKRKEWGKELAMVRGGSKAIEPQAVLCHSWWICRGTKSKLQHHRNYWIHFHEWWGMKCRLVSTPVRKEGTHCAITHQVASPNHKTLCLIHH